jgi:nitrogen regulatory protein PII
MRRVFASFALLTFLLMASVSPAADEKPKDPKARKIVDLSKVAEAGPGVYNIEFDAKGRIVSMLAVGSSRISTVLGAAKGKEVARQRASLQADAEFVKFLKAEVRVCEKTDDETVLFLEGNEGNDKDAINESGKAIEKTSTKMELSAKGLVRGMKIAHVEIAAADKTYYVVKKWTLKNTEAVKKVEAALKEDAKTGKTGDTTTKSKAVDKTLKDKKITIEDD